MSHPRLTSQRVNMTPGVCILESHLFSGQKGLIEGLARGGKMVVYADHLGETQENVKRKSSMAIQ